MDIFMRELFKVDGIVYKSLYLVYQLMMLNILWFVFCLPVITAGASTTALYYVVGKIIRKEEAKEFRDFFRSFRENFKTATAIWLMLCAAYIAIFTNLTYFNYTAWFSSFMYIIQLPILVQLVIINVLVFPLLSRYEISVMKAIKASWILGNRHILAVAASVIVTILVLLAVRLYPPLFLFLFASFIALATYLIMFNTLEKNHPGRRTTMPGADV